MSGTHMESARAPCASTLKQQSVLLPTGLSTIHQPYAADTHAVYRSPRYPSSFSPSSRPAPPRLSSRGAPKTHACVHGIMVPKGLTLPTAAKIRGCVHCPPPAGNRPPAQSELGSHDTHLHTST